MENKYLTAGKCEVIFILKNENKTYAEIAKLLKISRISVYYTLKNFGPISFLSHKNQSGWRRKTTKNDDDRIVIKSMRNRHLTASDITSEMNQSLPMYASCIQRSQIWIHQSRGFFPIAELSNVDDFCLLQKFALILNAQEWFLVVNSAEKIGLIEATFQRRYKRRTLAGSGSSPK
jgi:hypothetical protein